MHTQPREGFQRQTGEGGAGVVPLPLGDLGGFCRGTTCEWGRVKSGLEGEPQVCVALWAPGPSLQEKVVSGNP